jgi:hypothetical protein
MLKNDKVTSAKAMAQAFYDYYKIADNRLN